MSAEPLKSGLKPHEWLSILLLIGIILGITLFTTLFNVNPPVSFNPAKESIEVIVKGAVVYPGLYHFPKAIPMQEVLELAQTTPEADLRRYKRDQLIKRSRSVIVPAHKMITVYIEGAVKDPKPLRIPHGKSMSDLISLITPAENANLKVLEKKRRLKDGEIIVIPKLGQ